MAINVNPLTYDAYYPSSADLSTNEDAKIESMEKNIDKKVHFQTEDGCHYYGVIKGVSNSEHYRVQTNDTLMREWYIREDSIHFVVDPLDSK